MIATTISDTHPEAVKSLQAAGFPAIAEACQHFPDQTEMVIAIGIGKFTISGWMGGRMPSRAFERRVAAWLRDQKSKDLAPVAQDSAPAPVAKADAPGLLIVACPAGTEAKARRLLAMLGCEVEEV